MTTPKKPSTMKPSQSSIPFAKGIVLPQPLVVKIDRGMRDIEVNYNLRGRVKWLHAGETFAVYVLDEPSTTPVLELITAGEAGEPFKQVTNKSIGGWNKFLPMAAEAIAKKYGQQAAQQRKTA